MRTPDWEMTQGDGLPLIEIDLTGLDGTALGLAVGDTARFEYQRSGNRGPVVAVDAEVVSRDAPAKLRAPSLSDIEPGRYDSWFIVTFVENGKELTWPNDGTYFGRVYRGAQQLETSP